MQIRLTTKEDYKETEFLTREAFWNVYGPGCSEHFVLHQLRKADVSLEELDYVAEEKGQLVGNIVYTKMFHDGKRDDTVICFGPVGVLPQYQKKGIGAALIETSLNKAKELGYKAVMITGNPQYYKNFGFFPAADFGVYLKGMSPEEPADFFMIKELEPGYMKLHQGEYSFDEAYETDPEQLEEFDKGFPEKTKREPRPDDLF
nr:N-acetyltransferase [uncultured Sellimonas sp.]